MSVVIILFCVIFTTNIIFKYCKIFRQYILLVVNKSVFFSIVHNNYFLIPEIYKS